MTAATLKTCRECADESDHCHDTLVVHETGYVECTEAGCHALLLRHSLILSCVEMGCRCGLDSAN